MFKIVDAPRPGSEEDFSFQYPGHKGQFVECVSCRSKPGWPALCRGCLHNREVIGNLQRSFKETQREHGPRLSRFLKEVRGALLQTRLKWKECLTSLRNNSQPT